MKTQWKPIETAPKNGGNIILAIPFLDGYTYYIGHFSCDTWSDGDIDLVEVVGQPTHWMRLPDAPS